MFKFQVKLPPQRLRFVEQLEVCAIGDSFPNTSLLEGRLWAVRSLLKTLSVVTVYKVPWRAHLLPCLSYLSSPSPRVTSTRIFAVFAGRVASC